MTQEDVDLGRRVRSFREALGMTQTDVAKGMQAFGLPFHQQTMWKVEDGCRRLRVIELKPLASVFGVSIDALLGADSAAPARGIDELLALLTTARLSELERIRDAALTAIAIRSEVTS